MGYKEIKSQVSLSSSNATLNTQNQQKLINSPLTELNELNTIKLKTMYPLPDEMQMLPFKPVRNARKNILLIRINLLVKIFF
jgi:hypothetical protein